MRHGYAAQYPVMMAGMVPVPRVDVFHGSYPKCGCRMLPVPRVRGIILMLHLGDGPAAHAVLRVDGADGSYQIGNGRVVSQSINAVFFVYE